MRSKIDGSCIVDRGDTDRVEDRDRRRATSSSRQFVDLSNPRDIAIGKIREAVHARAYVREPEGGTPFRRAIALARRGAYV